MAFLYVPNGKNMVDWTPATFGANYQLTPILQPLAAHQKDFTVITGMAHMQEAAMGDGGGGHARAAGTYLTGHHPRKTSGANIQSAISVDQVAANAVGDQTASLRWNSPATRARRPVNANRATVVPISSTSPGNPPRNP